MVDIVTSSVLWYLEAIQDKDRDGVLIGSTERIAETSIVMLWVEVTFRRVPLVFSFQLVSHFTAAGKPSSGS